MSEPITTSATEHESPVVRLLDDITAQFRHQPVEQAAPQIVGHIRQFWAPRMRADLLSNVQSPTGDELTDAVVAQLRSIETRPA